MNSRISKKLIKDLNFSITSKLLSPSPCQKELESTKTPRKSKDNQRNNSQVIPLDDDKAKTI